MQSLQHIKWHSNLAVGTKRDVATSSSFLRCKSAEARFSTASPLMSESAVGVQIDFDGRKGKDFTGL